ncbi:hypothetical protein RJT34_03168 [Clitoria ternatea]|uniref:tRNA-specific 2-thiouridylase MnmA-like C-terminal domain-containing protein n=1 Tax=Clitoria ternatea TaxID=43366 RepID=A0AAN9KKC1_CLITE
MLPFTPVTIPAEELLSPLGCIPKYEVRRLATKFDPPNKDRKDSQGICFLGKGLRLPGGPWYVVEKDIKNNVIFVSRNYFSFDKRRRVLRVGSLKWISGLPPSHLSQLHCKVRHGPEWKLSDDEQGLAAGQFAAFYEGKTCIGSGVILESWDDQSFPVCAKALEIAKMEDKSKIGNPVKIKVEPDNPQVVCDSTELSSKTSN